MNTLSRCKTLLNSQSYQSTSTSMLKNTENLNSKWHNKLLKPMKVAMGQAHKSIFLEPVALQITLLLFYKKVNIFSTKVCSTLWMRAWQSSDHMVSLVSHYHGAISSGDCRQMLISTRWTPKDSYKWLNRRYSDGWAHSREAFFTRTTPSFSTSTCTFHSCLSYSKRLFSKRSRTSLNSLQKKTKKRI